MRNIVILLVCMISVQTLIASKTSYRTGESCKISQLDSLPGDLFFGGRSLTMEGTVKGNIIAAGQRINIAGNVENDVFSWGETVEVSGIVGENVIGFGRSIVIDGVVNGDVISYGGFVHIRTGSEIKGDVYVGSGQLTLEDAVINGGILGGASDIYLNGQVGKDIKLDAGHIRFGNEFSSNGSIKLIMKEEPGKIENAPNNLEIEIKPVSYFFSKFSFFWFLISAYIIGVILIVLFRPLHDNIIAFGNEKFMLSSGVGALFLIITPLAAILAITVLPLAFILTAIYMIVLYLSKIFVSYLGGRFLFQRVMPNKSISPYLSFLVGLVVITLLLQIPVLGIIISILIMIIGSGTFIYYIFRVREKHNHLRA